MARAAGLLVRVTACLLAAAAGTACTGTAPPPETDNTGAPTSGAPTTASAVPGPAASGTRRLQVVPVARVPLRGLPQVAGLKLVGSRVLLAGCADCSRDGDAGALYVHDLRTGRTARVATTAFPGGIAVPLGGSGTRVVWQDVAPVPPQLSGRTQWRLDVLDLATGRSRRLAGTTPATRSAPPWTVVRDDLVAWQDFEGESLAGPVHVADLDGAEPVVARDLPGPLADVTPGALLYVGAWPPPGRGLDVADPGTPSDAFTLPLSGGAATPLSATHDVGSVATDGTTVVWTTPRGASTTVWAGPLGGGPARIVYQGGNVERVPGDSFVAVLTDGEPVLRVAPLEGGRVLTLPDVPLADAGLAADGARLAYVAAPGRATQPDARHPLELVVVDVR